MKTVLLLAMVLAVTTVASAAPAGKSGQGHGTVHLSTGGAGHSHGFVGQTKINKQGNKIRFVISQDPSKDNTRQGFVVKGKSGQGHGTVHLSKGGAGHSHGIVGQSVESKSHSRGKVGPSNGTDGHTSGGVQDAATKTKINTEVNKEKSKSVETFLEEGIKIMLQQQEVLMNKLTDASSKLEGKIAVLRNSLETLVTQLVPDDDGQSSDNRESDSLDSKDRPKGSDHRRHDRKRMDSPSKGMNPSHKQRDSPRHRVDSPRKRMDSPPKRMSSPGNSTDSPRKRS